MKILIAYSSATGTTKKCANMLAEQLSSHEVTLCDLSAETPCLDGYDFAAVGGYIRRGKLCRHTKKFIEDNREALLGMRAGYFICCGYTDSAGEYIRRNIPAELLASAVYYTGFGGVLNPKLVHGFDRLLVRIAIKSVLDDGSRDGEPVSLFLPSIFPESIGLFAQMIKGSFAK